MYINDMFYFRSAKVAVIVITDFWFDSDLILRVYDMK